MKRETDSWDTITPYQGATKHDLPPLSVLFFDSSRFQLNAGPWTDYPEILQLKMYGEIEDGAIVFNEVNISAPSITPDTLRRPRIGDLRTAIATWLKREPESIDIRTRVSFSSSDDDAYIEGLDRDASQGRAVGLAASKKIRTTGRLPGRPTLPDDLLRLVAEVYIDEFARASGRSFIPAMAKRLETELGRQEIPESTVSHWIRQSRKQGWLRETTKGNPNAEPGPRLIAYYENEKEGEEE